MVIGVVPRYDPHGMGLPIAPPPGAVGVPPSAGAGAGAGGARQRAATASSLDQAREVGYFPFILLLPSAPPTHTWIRKVGGMQCYTHFGQNAL